MSDDRISAEEAASIRAQERIEEEEYREETRALDPKYNPDIVAVKRTARAVRGWILSRLVPDAVVRMYEIGMGVQTFDTPTMAGNVVQIEAPPAVQQRALQSLIALGLPSQVGLVDDDGNALPGVLALGALDLDAARMEAHGERYVAPEAHARAMAALSNGNGVEGTETPRPMTERIANGEFTVIETEEGLGALGTPSEDLPPGAISDVETPAKAALRRHRERVKARPVASSSTIVNGSQKP